MAKQYVLDMTKGNETSLLLRFTLPMLVGNIFQQFYNMVDSVIVGRFVGTNALGAVGSVGSITFMFFSLCLGLGSGIGILISQYFGAGQDDYVKRIIANAIYITLGTGALMSLCGAFFAEPILHLMNTPAENFADALTYMRIVCGFTIVVAAYNTVSAILRALGDAKTPLIFLGVASVLNIALDPLFIFGFHWGIKGAAWATVIGQIASGCLVIVYFVRFKKMGLTVEMLKPRGMYIKGILTLGMASCINQIAMAIVQIVLNNTLRYYGSLSVYGSDIPLACVGVIAKVNMVFMAICIGLAQGCQPIWGFNYGAGNYVRVRLTYKRSMQIALAVGGICFVCFQVFPRQIVSIFGNGSEEYFRFAERYFRIYMFMTFVNGIHPVCSQFFTAIGKATKGAVVSLTRQILFLLPLIIIFPIFIGIDGVMYAGPIADGTAAVVAIVLARSEIKKMS